MFIPQNVELLLLNTPQSLAANGAGDGVTNDGPVFNSLLSSSRQVTVDTPPTAWLIDTTVNVPSSFSVTKSLRGVGKGGKIITAASPNLTNNVLFRLNANPDGTAITSYSNNAATVVEDLYINAAASFANNVGILAFLFNGSTIFRNVSMNEVSTGFRFGNAYNDLVEIVNVTLLSQLIVDSNSWIIDLLQSSSGGGGGGYVNSAGDGVLISGVQAGGAFSGGVATRCNTVRASNHHQLKIERVLNGDIYLLGCVNPKLSNNHFENGHTTIQQCQGALVEESAYYMCAASTINAGTPLIISSANVSSDSATQNSVTLKGLVFYYLPTASGNLMMDRTGVPNLSLTGPFSVEVEKLVCGFTPNNYQSFSERGVTTGIADFDNYSHVASLKSRLTNGGGPLSVIDVNFSHCFSAARNTTAAVCATLDSGAIFFNQASGTYYYKVNILYDAKRRIGYSSNEVSIAVTNGGNSARIYFAACDLCQPVMIEVYRGTTSGTYDHVLRYPYIDGRSLHDLGDCINGTPWTTRTAGAMEAINAGLLAGTQLTSGDTASTSDAYGHAEVWTDSNTMPTTGAWRRGDKVWLRTPVVTNDLSFIGWVRLTDCTEATPANVLGTDWQKMYIDQSGAISAINGAPVPSSKTIVGTNGSGQIIDASIATLSNNTSGTAANLSGTPALPNGVTATTQAAGDNSTKLATTAYADQRAFYAQGDVTDTVTAATANAGTGNVAPFTKSATIPANTMKASTLLRVTLAGSITTSSGTPPIMTIALKLGTATVWAGNTGLVPNASEGSYPFGMSFLVKGTAAPSSASNVITNIYPGGGVSGVYQPHTSSSYNPSQSQATNGALVLQPYLYASSNMAGNFVTLNQMVVEVVQP